MFAKLAICLLLLATPAYAADTIPDTLALSDEDAATCKVTACRTITDAAYAKFLEFAERADKVERLAIQQAREMAKKPKFCL